jgi:hypothetical protein
VNGEAVYASRPFEAWGDTTVIYTRASGHVYATRLGWNGGAVTLSALKSGGATLGTVSKVELLGSTLATTFSQSSQGLIIRRFARAALLRFRSGGGCCFSCVRRACCPIALSAPYIGRDV